jgi:TPR repeat protein
MRWNNLKSLVSATVLLTLTNVSQARESFAKVDQPGIGPAASLSQQPINKIEQAADIGNVQAQYKLALMLEYGEGIKQDHARAAALHQKAAQNGSIGAQHSLGMMYYQGKGVRTNKINAYIWLAMAADNGYESVIIARDRVAQELSESGLVQAKRAYEEQRSNQTGAFNNYAMLDQ